MAEKLACPHGMPSRGSCVDCMAEGPVAEPERWEKVGDPFRARFDGECSCGQPIVADVSRVQRWDKGGAALNAETRYRHDDCGSPR